MDTVNEIIESLLNHEITKRVAVERLKNLANGMLPQNGIEFNVESVAFSVKDDHGFLRLVIPYGYAKITGIFNEKDEVVVIKKA
mgnify:CR=1 FL=1